MRPLEPETLLVETQKDKPREPANSSWRAIVAAAFALAAFASAYTRWPRKAECTDLAWSLVQKTERLFILRGFAADCKGGRYGDLADEELSRRDFTEFDEA